MFFDVGFNDIGMRVLCVLILCFFHENVLVNNDMHRFYQNINLITCNGNLRLWLALKQLSRNCGSATIRNFITIDIMDDKLVN